MDPFFFKQILFRGEQLCQHSFRRNVIYFNSLRDYRNNAQRRNTISKNAFKMFQISTQETWQGFISFNLGFSFFIFYILSCLLFLIFVIIQLLFSDYKIIKLFEKYGKVKKEIKCTPNFIILQLISSDYVFINEAMLCIYILIFYILLYSDTYAIMYFKKQDEKFIHFE